ncbi:hypothetical protein GJ496_008572 [Pomphorhynchus laevis]|nr:hypothetical protein GJ496_008572 [Pomphorhynchus laevis]
MRPAKSKIEIGELVWVKPAEATCTSRWLKGVVTNANSRSIIEVNGIPRHKTHVRHIIKPKSTIGDESESRSPVRDISYSFETDNTSEEGSSVTSDEDFDPILTGCSNDRNEIKGHLINDSTLQTNVIVVARRLLNVDIILGMDAIVQLGGVVIDSSGLRFVKSEIHLENRNDTHSVSSYNYEDFELKFDGQKWIAEYKWIDSPPNLLNTKSQYNSTEDPQAAKKFREEIVKWIEQGILVNWVEPVDKGILSLMAIKQHSKGKVRPVMDYRNQKFCGRRFSMRLNHSGMVKVWRKRAVNRSLESISPNPCSSAIMEISVGQLRENYILPNQSELVWVKPAEATCTSRWLKGIVTNANSRSIIKVNGIPRHKTHVRHIIKPKSTIGDESESRSPVRDISYSFETDDTSEEGSSVTSDEDFDPILTGCSNDRNEIKGHLTDHTILKVEYLPPLGKSDHGISSWIF